MARAREIEGLRPSTSLAEAAARTVSVRSAEVFGFADGVLDSTDIDAVHDMRVATRRLRAAIEAYRNAFPRSELQGTLREVKHLARALGARRDPDVALEQIDAIAGGLPPSALPGIAFFSDQLRAEQATANVELERALAQAVDGDLPAKLTRLAEAARGRETTLDEHAKLVVARRRAKLEKRIRRALRRPEPSALHDARIAAKRLRYVYEIARPCFPEEALIGIKHTRAIQDVLGEIHDCDVLSARARAGAERIALADPRYLGLEALASYLEAKRRVLHRQFVQMVEDKPL